MNTETFKKKIEAELTQVETQLKTVGRINPSNPKDWEAVPPDENVEPADEAEVAENLDSYEENTGILKQLEIRYNELKEALKRIEAGTYGICTVGKEQIETDRLEANPAATTCKKHLI